MFKIIQNNPDFIVVSKPPDVNFHNENEDSGFFNIVRDYLKCELYPVHRLDRITSGIILFAKNKDAANKLSILFRNREVDKYYIALSDKKPAKKMGRIAGGMERTRNGQWKLNRTSLNFSITNFTSVKLSNDLILFIIKPLTGRTHQIRVALKSIGSPIIGDTLYYSSATEYDRGYLHSWSIHFKFKGRPYSFTDNPEYGIFFIDDAFKDVINQNIKPDFFKMPR